MFVRRIGLVEMSQKNLFSSLPIQDRVARHTLRTGFSFILDVYFPFRTRDAWCCHARNSCVLILGAW
jgi:hypothetical protein